MVESPVSPSSSIPAPLLSEASSGLQSKTKLSKNIDSEIKRRNIEDKSHWKLDRDAKSCFICNSSFGMYIRKHHCRKCGEIICDSCSNFVEVTKNDFIFHTEQANLVGTNQRFCCKCTREREGDEKAVMAKS